MDDKNDVLIFGATGNMGGSVARELLRRGWPVRAVTRRPESENARALASLGAELVRADMDDRASLEAAFDGIERVFSVQSWTPGGMEEEVRQGKRVAEVARAAGVKHLVYGSGGIGEPDTGVPHFQAKVEVESYLRILDLPFTILRPGPFMELLTEKAFYPVVSSWGTEPAVVGWDTPKPWVAVRDIGIAVANILEQPQAWMRRSVNLFGDVKSMSACKTIFTEIDGKKPLGIPLPLWLFRRIAGSELILMWQWLAEYAIKQSFQDLWDTVESSRLLCPKLHDMESWLKAKRSQGEVSLEGRIAGQDSKMQRRPPVSESEGVP